jgi:pimeloyl-ACP methyl ester carboxylesterase
LDNAATFDRLAPLCTDVCFLAVDLPGHGLSEHRSANANYGFAEWIPDVFAMADEFGWERFTLLGHSMGAGIASLAAGTLPHRIERLALIEGLGPLTAAPEEAPAQLAAHIEQCARRMRIGSRPLDSRDEAVRRVVQATSGLTRELARRLVERSTRVVDGGVQWRWDPRLRATSAVRFTEEQVLAFLGRIACPTLLIRAQRGYPFDPQTMARRIQAVAELRVVEVEGGHHVHLEHPQGVAKVVRPFLAGA